MTKHKPSIVIIEDHPLVLNALASFFNETGRWQLAGTASSLDEAKELLPVKSFPDILLLDIQLEDSLGLNIIPWLKGQLKQSESLPVIAVYSAYDDFVHVSAALGMGVKVYMCKRRSVNELEQALFKALKGESFIDETVQTKLDSVTNIFNLLTKREAQILTLVNSGLSDKQIAQKLGISPRTVQNIVYCIFDKTGIRSRVELQKL
ncbi:MAG: response regulator transcription factor [Treponema sp.]|nr:response regulator transcription factor [Treponema sp.]